MLGTESVAERSSGRTMSKQGKIMHGKNWKKISSLEQGSRKPNLWMLEFLKDKTEGMEEKQ